MTTHDLKTWPEYYAAVADGFKPFEVRAEDNRRFAVGDTLVLCEYEPFTQQYTDKSLRCRVTYVLRDWPGLMLGYAVLGLAEVDAPASQTSAAQVAGNVASAFGMALLRQRLEEGHAIEIPSLGIALTKADIQE